jgi:hypothetical protein
VIWEVGENDRRAADMIGHLMLRSALLLPPELADMRQWRQAVGGLKTLAYVEPESDLARSWDGITPSTRLFPEKNPSR